MIHGVVGAAPELLRAFERGERAFDEADVQAELTVAGRPGDFAPDRLDAFDERQRIAERRARPIAQRRGHEGVRDGVERGLGREAEDLVVERSCLRLLSGRFVEAHDPGGDELLASRAEPGVVAAELNRGLLAEDGRNEHRSQDRCANGQGHSTRRHPRCHHLPPKGTCYRIMEHANSIMSNRALLSHPVFPTLSLFTPGPTLAAAIARGCSRSGSPRRGPSADGGGGRAHPRCSDAAAR